MRKRNVLLFSKDDTWVRPYLKKYKKLLILVLLLGILTFFCGAALMFTSGYLISKSATKPYNILLIYIPIVLTRAFGIGRPSFRYIERLTSHNWVLKMTSDLRVKLYQSLESRAMQARIDFQTGDILGVLTEDIEHIQNLYLRTIFPTLIAWGLYILIVIGLGLFSIPFALVMLLLIGILTILYPLVFVLTTGKAVYKRKQKRNDLYIELTDSVLGVADWQYSGRYGDFLTHYQESEEQVWQEDKVIKQSIRKQRVRNQFVFGFIIVLLFLWSGQYFYGTGTEGLNWIAAFVLAFFPLIDAFAPISEGMMEMPIYEDTVQRLHKLPHPEQTQAKNTDIPTITHFDIALDKVSFCFYPNQRKILDELSLQIPQGHKMAILGRSGTGKTTLTKLIQGDLLPVSGSIFIGGQEAANVVDNNQAILAVLSQSPHLFNTSIYNNIHLGNVDASEEEVQRAMEQAGLRPLIDKLPEGMQTIVEEGGKRFSGGEQQRIALARILLQDAPIIILDEPTVGLDPITEKSLLETIFQVLSGKTVLWITHHLIGIHHVDEVVFLDKGKIEMAGTPRELLAENLHFQHLYQLDTAQ